jgi:hypothetical protein
VNGWNLHGGLTIGYLGSNTKDATPDLNPPTSFRDSLQTPFVGVYGIRTRLSRTSGTTGPRFAGLLGGGKIGYNYQVGNGCWASRAMRA